ACPRRPADTRDRLRVLRPADARTRSRDARRCRVPARGRRDVRDVPAHEPRRDHRGAHPSSARKEMTKPSLRTIVRRALEGEAKLPRGSRVLLAVSGGPDSMALLDVMADHSAAFDLRLLAHGVDHGLRSTAAGELDRAEGHADGRAVPF